jgi:hypothetical protein
VGPCLKIVTTMKDGRMANKRVAVWCVEEDEFEL